MRAAVEFNCQDILAGHASCDSCSMKFLSLNIMYYSNLTTNAKYYRCPLGVMCSIAVFSRSLKGTHCLLQELQVRLTA